MSLLNKGGNAFGFKSLMSSPNSKSSSSTSCSTKKTKQDYSNYSKLTAVHRNDYMTVYASKSGGKRALTSTLSM